jgi:hypothetical protein
VLCGLTLTGSQVGAHSSNCAVVTSDRAGNGLQIRGDNGATAAVAPEQQQARDDRPRTPRATPGRAGATATIISGTLMTCRMTSDRNPPRVPPPSITLAASTTALQ